MRHGKKFNHLSRKTGHRRAMLSNMATSLILHKRINTTLAKAKALRLYVEPLITKSKTDSTHSRRQVFSYLQDKEAVIQLFRDVAVKVATRPGGYTRIIKTGNRLGDNAEMCLIELVDYNEIYTGSGKAEVKPKTTRRSRKSPAKKAADATADKATDATAEVKEAKPKAKKAPKAEAAPETEAPKAKKAAPKKKAEGDDKAE